MFRRKHNYSFMGTDLILKLSPKTARAYNQAQHAFISAQKRNNPNDPFAGLSAPLTKTQRAAWSHVAKLVNDALAKGMVLMPDDMLNDSLNRVK